MKKAKLYQQGDVLLHPITALPAGKKGLKPKTDNIVAVGEATGHFHDVIGEDVEVFENDLHELFVRAPKGATIRHQEHHAIEVPPGIYKVGVVQEFDYALMSRRPVVD